MSRDQSLLINLVHLFTRNLTASFGNPIELFKHKSRMCS